MWFNQAKCDIYIGTGAGTKLLKEIANAQRSVKIISPYLSPKMIEELVWLHQKGIQVRLITTDTLENTHQKQLESIKRLIVQERVVDERAQGMRQRWTVMVKYLILASVILTVVSCYLLIHTKNPFYLAGLGFPVLGYLGTKRLKKKIRSKRIYNYRYKPLFPFRAFIAPDKNKINDTFIHGKIYSIDGHTAYMGSLNFTESGTKYNYETRIRVTDKEAITKIEEEFDELFHDADLAFFGVADWGKSLYEEAVN